jgi:hypothetical protein
LYNEDKKEKNLNFLKSFRKRRKEVHLEEKEHKERKALQDSKTVRYRNEECKTFVG